MISKDLLKLKYINHPANNKYQLNNDIKILARCLIYYQNTNINKLILNKYIIKELLNIIIIELNHLKVYKIKSGRKNLLFFIVIFNNFN